MPKPKKITAKKVILTSILVDASDVVLNTAVAILTGSVVMLAQLLEGVSDLLSSFLLYLGLRSSEIQPSRRHPFGQGKEIYFWSLISAFVMATLAAGLSFYFGYQRFLNPEPVKNIYLTFAVLSLGLVFNGYAFSLSFRRILGKRDIRKIFALFFQTHLVATKNAFVLDLMGTVAAIIGLISLGLYQTTGILHFDAMGAMAIGMVLAFLAVTLVAGIKNFIVGRSAPPGVEEEIRKIVLEEPEVEEVLDLKTMLVGGDNMLVNLEVHVRGSLTVDEAEVLIDRIKERLVKEVETIQHVQIELETPDKL